MTFVKELGNPIVSEDVKEITDNDLPWDKLSGKTCLVTGASGMIPSYVVYTLLGLNDRYGLGIKVLALVRNEKKARRIFGAVLERDDIKLLVQDVCEPVVTDNPIDYIFHGGSAARPSAHKSSPTSTIKANLTGTLNLLDLAVNKKSEAFLMMSSSEVYGQADPSLGTIKETDYGPLDILNPRSCYSEGKRAAETIAACYKEEFGIDCKLPRFAQIYGPGMALDDGRVQADFAANVFRGQNIVLKSDGSSVRAYTYVADAVAGVFFVLLKGEDLAYNIADSGSIISIRQLAEAFLDVYPERGLKLIFDIPESTGNLYNPAKFIGLDDSKLRALGWKAKVNVKTGTKRMLESYKYREQ